MMKKVFSLLLALTLCLGLCIPAFAADAGINAEPRMRNSDYYSTPPFGTSSSAYTSYLGARYGNLQLESLLCNAATNALAGWVTGGISSFFTKEVGQIISGVVGSGVIGATGVSLKTAAMQHAPNSKVVGYVMYTFEYPSPPPTEHYYQYTIVYYPTAVSSGQPLPAGGTFPIQFNEYNWFS